LVVSVVVWLAAGAVLTDHTSAFKDNALLPAWSWLPSTTRPHQGTHHSSFLVYITSVRLQARSRRPRRARSPTPPSPPRTPAQARGGRRVICCAAFRVPPSALLTLTRSVLLLHSPLFGKCLLRLSAPRCVFPDANAHTHTRPRMHAGVYPSSGRLVLSTGRDLRPLTVRAGAARPRS
jgi:hypothetical protein